MDIKNLTFYEDIISTPWRSPFDTVDLYLRVMTGQSYTVAQAAGRKWGDGEEESGIFYQIMPEAEDDGFFDWYCEERPYNQFFKNIDHAVLHFLLHRRLWKEKQMV